MVVPPVEFEADVGLAFVIVKVWRPWEAGVPSPCEVSDKALACTLSGEATKRQLLWKEMCGKN